MNEQIQTIKNWLQAGSINIFGVPFAGKDTQGEILAEYFGGEMISSGDILRHNKDNQRLQQLLDAGEIIPSDLFEEIVVPYFSREDLSGKPLILSEVGRLEGEHTAVIHAANASGHKQKAVVLLKLEDSEIWRRFAVSQQENSRGERGDDKREVLQTRLDRYHSMVEPVINYYRELGVLIEIDGSVPKEEVTKAIIDGLEDFATRQ